MKSFWNALKMKSKTINVAVVLGMLGVIQANLGLLQLSAKTYGWLMVGVSVVMVYLRSITTNSLGDK